MPLTHRGREILDRLPGAMPRGGNVVGCEIVRHEELCVGCGTCGKVCPTGSSRLSDTFDVNQLLDAPADSRRGALGAALRRLARHAPSGPVDVPERVTVYRTVIYHAEKCLGCGTCARACPAEAIEAIAPKIEAGATRAPATGGPAAVSREAGQVTA